VVENDASRPVHPAAEHLSFGELVRQRRQRLLLTQEELAEKSGLSARSIQNIEAGRVRRPWRTTVDLLCTALGLDASDRETFDRTARLGRLAADRPRPTPADLEAVAVAVAHIHTALQLLSTVEHLTGRSTV
jgi:transcriptional regulator with XRE-family HTH domain